MYTWKPKVPFFLYYYTSLYRMKEAETVDFIMFLDPTHASLKTLQGKKKKKPAVINLSLETPKNSLQKCY